MGDGFDQFWVQHNNSVYILSYWCYLAEVTLENLSKDQSSREVRIYSGKIKIED